MQSERVFLPCSPDGPPLLERAAARLLEGTGPDLDGILIALPGARATRNFEEALARAAGPALRPPEVLTTGLLSDRLLPPQAPRADRVTRTLAWCAALRGATPTALAPFLPHPPEQEDFRSWWSLASRLRSLHAELAAAGHDFAAVAAHLGQDPAAPAAEGRRWEALAALQADWRARLAATGLADPHETRLAALAEQRIAHPRAVILIGVVEMNTILRRALEACPAPIQSLVLVPAPLAPRAAERYDELGCLIPAAWADGPGLAELAEHWTPVDRPADQARELLRVLASWRTEDENEDGTPPAPRWTAEELSIGVPDEEVVPELRRALGAHGIRSRHAAGTPLRATSAWRLLDALAAWLEGRSPRALAALFRHPALALPSPALDAYLEEVFPLRLDPPPAGHRPPGPPRPAGALAPALRRLGELCPELRADDSRPIADWAPAARAFLRRAFGEDTLLRPEIEEERLLHGSLAALERSFAAFEAAPAELLASAPLRAPAALHLFLEEAAAASIPPRPEEDAVELLGWLELPLDPAPALLLTGFQEGLIPSSTRGDSFLPDRLRTALGLPDSASRAARDACLLALLLHTRRDFHLFSSRRSTVGDPLLPSRLLFLDEPRRAARNLRRALSETEKEKGLPRPASPCAEDDGPPAPPDPQRSVIAMRVTSFRDYILSPLYFLLRHVLRLESVTEPGPEMDPMHFGTLAHSVLQDFGESPDRDSTDPARIQQVLDDLLQTEVRHRFGSRPHPIATLQTEQLRLRLHAFARWQARRAAAGWRILAVECALPADCALPLAPWPDGPARPAPMRVRGRIDRIDHHPGKGWAILDYKTSGTRKKPSETHKRSGEWKDLQLPLYARFAARLDLPIPIAAEPGDPKLQVGYLALSGDPDADPLLLADWEEEDFEDADRRAEEIARAVRRGLFAEVAQFPDRDPILAAIAGVGLQTPPPTDDSDESPLLAEVEA